MQWVWFIVGQVLNVLRQAKLVAQSRSNPVGTKWGWIRKNAIGLAIREAAAIGAWMLLVHPDAGPAILESFKPGMGQYANIFVQLPFLACPFGIVFSIFFDERLESSPNIKKHIPKLENGLVDDNGKGKE